MTYETIRAAIQRQPFKPFAIRTGSGGEFTVSHPENIMASPRIETVFLKHDGDKAAIIDLDAITELTYLTSAPAGREGA